MSRHSFPGQGFARLVGGAFPHGEWDVEPLVVGTIDVQRAGLALARPCTVRLRLLTGALAAGLYSGSLALMPARGKCFRLLRAQAWVRDATLGSTPFVAGRSLDNAVLSVRQGLPSDEELAAVGSSNGVTAVALTGSEGGAPGDIDRLVQVAASASRLAWESSGPGLVCVGEGVPGANVASGGIAFGWNRTAALNDEDAAFLIAHVLVSELGAIPPA